MAEIRRRLMFTMFNSNKGVCVSPLTALLPATRPGVEATRVGTHTPPAEAQTAQSQQGLALALTPGLGATRARRLVEYFGRGSGLSRIAHRTRSHTPAGGVRPARENRSNSRRKNLPRRSRRAFASCRPTMQRILRASAKSTTRRSSFMYAAPSRCSRKLASPWSGIPRLTGRGWPSV